MVTKENLVRMWSHFNDQANTPFTGAGRARFIEKRIDKVLDSPLVSTIVRTLPKDTNQAIKLIENMDDESFESLLRGERGGIKRDKVNKPSSPSVQKVDMTPSSRCTGDTISDMGDHDRNVIRMYLNESMKFLTACIQTKQVIDCPEAKEVLQELHSNMMKVHKKFV